MSQHYIPTQPEPVEPQPTADPQPRTTKVRNAVGAAITASLLAFGLGIASAGTDTPAAPAKAETVTEHVEVGVVPDVCLEALDAADQVITIAADGLGASAEVMEAAGRFDLAGVEAGSAVLDELNAEVLVAGDTYMSAKNECRREAGQ